MRHSCTSALSSSAPLPVLYKTPSTAHVAAESRNDALSDPPVVADLETHLVPDLRIRKRCWVIYRRAPAIPERGNEHPYVEFTPQAGLRTFFKLLFAAASMIFRPVTVDPVNATLSTSM